MLTSPENCPIPTRVAPECEPCQEKIIPLEIFGCGQQVRSKPRRSRGVIALATLALATGLSCAATLEAGTAASGPVGDAHRPRIALVLSGGGARGGAHIGVLKVLEDMHVPVDVVVGTSAGAIVGAAYVSGLSLDEIQTEMRQMNTSTLLQDVSRDDMPLRRKADDGANFIGPEFGLSRNGLALPTGAVSGASLDAVFRRLTRRQETTDFDQLPIPFRAVATDLATSEVVVLSHGQLVLAIRASSAVPGAVSPVEIDGRLLADGGLKRNLPVDVARALGADVVIAVNIGTPLLRREELVSAVSVSDQMLRILTEENVKASLRELMPQDVLITPELNGIASSDFDKLRQAMERGEAGARAEGASLARYSLPAAEYAALQARRFASHPSAWGRVDEVRVHGTNVVNPEFVSASMDTQPGKPFDLQQLDGDLQRLYALGDFESVNYSLDESRPDHRAVDVDVTEKSYGPDYIGLGLGLSFDSLGNSYFNLYASQRSSWLNALGAEWRNQMQIGHTDRAVTEWYQPLDVGQSLFVAPRLEFKDDPLEFYSPDGKFRLARFRLRSYGAGVDLGVPLGRSGEARLGIVNGRVQLTSDTFVVEHGVDDDKARTGGVLARVRVDQLDSLRFPSEGFESDGQVYLAQHGLGASDTYAKGTLNFMAATHAGRHTLLAAVRADGSLDKRGLPDYDDISFGGFQQLSGYRTGQLVADKVLFGRVNYQYRLLAPGILNSVYLGASLEAGRVHEVLDSTQGQRWRPAGSLYLGLDTPLGPVYFGVGRSDHGRMAGYFYLGRP